jgi:hypothetical protein
MIKRLVIAAAFVHLVRIIGFVYDWTGILRFVHETVSLQKGFTIGSAACSRTALFDSVFVNAPTGSNSRVTLCRLKEAVSVTGGYIGAQLTWLGPPTHRHTRTVRLAEATAPLGSR